MIKSSFKTLLLLSVGLFFTASILNASQIGDLLEEAMAARENARISEVSEKFMIAADAATSSKQRANVLFIFSDYLMEKGEWEKSIEVQQQILDSGNSSSRAGAFYNLIRANLELNRIDDAKMAAVELNACPAGESMRDHARTMKKLAPNSIYARISDMLTETALNPYLAEPSQGQTPLSSQISTRPVEKQPLPEPEAPKLRNSKQFSVMLGGWNSAMRGDLNSQGSSLSFGGDLSSKRETSVMLAAEYSPNPKDRFKATYANFHFSGTLNKTFVHNTKTYNPGAEFNLRSKFLDLEGFKELRQRSRVSWGVLYGIMLTHSDLEISQNIPGLRQITTWESRFGYPYLGVAAMSNHSGNIGWEASGKFFVWNGDGRYNTHDLELKLLFGQGSRKMSSRRKLWGYIGYRDFRWDGDFDEDSVELRFSGPIFGIEFFF